MLSEDKAELVFQILIRIQNMLCYTISQIERIRSYHYFIEAGAVGFCLILL